MKKHIFILLLVVAYPTASYSQHSYQCKSMVCYCDDEDSGVGNGIDSEINDLDLLEDIEESLDSESTVLAYLYPNIIDYFEWYQSVSPATAQYLYNIATENEDIANLLNYLVSNTEWEFVASFILLCLQYYGS